VPAAVRLVDLKNSGAEGNLHVDVTDVKYGDIYEPVWSMYRTRWVCVYVPLLADGKVRAVLKSYAAKNDEQIQTLTRRPGAKGVVVDELYSPLAWWESQGQRWQTPAMEKAYPGTIFSSLPIIEEGRIIPSATSVSTTALVAAAALAWACAAIVLTIRPRRQRQGNAAPDTRRVARLQATGLPRFDELGQLRRVFVCGTENTTTIASGIFIVALVGHIFVVDFVDLAAVVPLTRVVPLMMSTKYMILGIVELVILLLVVTVLSHRRDAAALYSEGLVSRCGRVTNACRWDDVESVSGLLRTAIRTGGEAAFTVGGPLRLNCSDGKKLIVSGFFDEEAEFLGIVREEISCRHFPKAVEALRRGETVRIGPLSAERNGLNGPKGSWLPWQDVSEVAYDTRLIVRRRDSQKPWWSGSLTTPDAPLLFDLVAAAERGDIG
jgi:hypothetical protein